MRIILAFVAGALAVPIFHQTLLWMLHAAGIVPMAPFNMEPTKPLGVPNIVSISFWGGVWGVLFALTLPRWFSGAAYWIAAPIAGGLALTLVFMLVVWPLKVGGRPPHLIGLFVIGLLLNAAWGIGWALLLYLFERMRSA
jgi:ABC-type Fe3+-siderophore transport system permease subunit